MEPTSSAKRPVLFQIFGHEPATVERDGMAMTKFATTAEFDAAKPGWRADAATGFIFIKAEHGGGKTSIQV